MKTLNAKQYLHEPNGPTWETHKDWGLWTQHGTWTTAQAFRLLFCPVFDCSACPLDEGVCSIAESDIGLVRSLFRSDFGDVETVIPQRFVEWGLGKSAIRVPEAMREWCEANPLPQEEVTEPVQSMGVDAVPKLIVSSRVSQNGSGKAQVINTVAENPEAVAYVQYWREHGKNDVELAQDLIRGGASKAVAGCILCPGKPSRDAAETHVKRLLKDSAPA